MKLLISSVFAILLVASGLAAQGEKPEVELTGTVLSVENAFDSKFPDKPFFRVNLYLQVRNNTDQTVFLLMQDRPTHLGEYIEPCFRKSIEFLSDQAGNRSIPAPHYAALDWRNINDPYPSRKQENACSLYADSLRSGYGRSRTISLEPNASSEFRESIVVDSGYEYELAPGQKWKDVEGREPKPLHPFFRVLYRLSLKDSHSELLRAKQQEWQKFGHLLLNSSGDYVLRSEVLTNFAPNTIASEKARP